MGFPWRKILKIGKTAGQIFLPDIVNDAIDRIEDKVIEMKSEGKQGWSGPEKQGEALQVILDGIIVAEGIANRDLLHDPVIEAAGKRAIDAVVEAKKALAELQAAVNLVKASKAA